jgi:hypothetical protein
MTDNSLEDGSVTKQPAKSLKSSTLQQLPVVLVCVVFAVVFTALILLTGQNSHNPAIPWQLKVVELLILIASLVVVARACRTFWLSFLLYDATLTLIPSESIMGHSFACNFQLKSKKNLDSTQIKTGLLCKARSFTHTHTSSQAKYSTLYKNCVTVEKTTRLEANKLIDLKQDIAVPESIKHGCPDFDLFWFAYIEVKLPAKLRYYAEFPIDVYKNLEKPKR